MSVIGSIFALLLALAAASDLARFRIPNEIVIALLVLFLVAAALNVHEFQWSNHLAAGGLCFGVTAALYSGRMMGAGDAKLLAVLGLWAGLMPLVSLLFWTSVAGLALVGVLVALRRAVLWTPVKALGWLPETLPRVLRKSEGVPYGIAIALGTLLASPSFPGWLWKL